MVSNVGGIAYGTVTIGALLAAESARQETYPETVLAVLVALALYWLAHSYATFTEERALARHAPGLRSLLDVMARESSILAGAIVPLMALLVCWAAGVALATAVDVATWLAAGMVIALELALGLRERLRVPEVAAQTAIGTVLGLLVIALRALLH